MADARRCPGISQACASGNDRAGRTKLRTEAARSAAGSRWIPGRPKCSLKVRWVCLRGARGQRRALGVSDRHVHTPHREASATVRSTTGSLPTVTQPKVRRKRAKSIRKLVACSSRLTQSLTASNRAARCSQRTSLPGHLEHHSDAIHVLSQR